MCNTRGFTLVELAIVLIVVTLIGTGLLLPMAGQVDARRARETREQLQQIKEALLGFAIANDRLPCPASATSHGAESFCEDGDPTAACVETTDLRTHGRCSHFLNGFLPAAALGVNPVDADGYALDAWQTNSSRIRYAVFDGTITDPSGNAYYALTRADGTSLVGVSRIAPARLLYVCASASGITAASCGGTGANRLSDQAPVVIFSVGGRVPATPGADEAENLDGNDRFFVSHEPAQASAPNGEYKHQVDWLSLGTLFSRLLVAGQLP